MDMAAASLARRVAAAAISATAIAIGAAPASADPVACPPTLEQAPTSCRIVTVPLDRSGGVPGDVHLFVEDRSSPQPSRGAIFVLAGGPGQAATPLIGPLEQLLGPALSDHELVVFDQRGTGASDPLDCPSIDNATAQTQEQNAVEGCAEALGPRRAFYTSRDSADDIDAVRAALGLDKISLYGVSYGTFTAVTYARRYPDRVQSLILDSVVNPNGRDPLDRSSYAAYPRVLRDICTGGCHGITHDPVADLARLASRLRRRPLGASAFTPHGHRITGTISEDDLVNVLAGGDLDPTARAEIPSSLASALQGDGASLARLLVREQGAAGNRAAQSAVTARDSQALFFATACEEIPFPWSRTAPLSARPGALSAALAAVPPSAFAPFDPGTEARTGTSRPCLGWPDGSPDSPLVSGPVPNVPVLLLSGVDDTRTPLSDAQAAASPSPQAQLLPVPQTGHSVLGTDPTSCSENAIESLLTGSAVQQCQSDPSLFPPSAVAPRSLAALRPVRGVRGKRGRTVAAVAGSLSDSVRQAVGYLLSGSSVAAGGLRGGTLRGSLSGSVLTLKLNKLVYVPGVRVSGIARVNF